MPETELHKAARDGDKDSVVSLIAEGLAVNEKGAQGAICDPKFHSAVARTSRVCGFCMLHRRPDTATSRAWWRLRGVR